MKEDNRQIYINKLTDNLPMLRMKLNLTQKELADIIGVSSYTVLAIEKKQRKMTWNTFLSIILVCMIDDDVRPILSALGIYDDTLINFIKGRGEVI